MTQAPILILLAIGSLAGFARAAETADANEILRQRHCAQNLLLQERQVWLSAASSRVAAFAPLAGTSLGRPEIQNWLDPAPGHPWLRQVLLTGGDGVGKTAHLRALVAYLGRIRRPFLHVEIRLRREDLTRGPRADRVRISRLDRPADHVEFFQHAMDRTWRHARIVRAVTKAVHDFGRTKAQGRVLIDFDSGSADDPADRLSTHDTLDLLERIDGSRAPAGRLTLALSNRTFNTLQIETPTSHFARVMDGYQRVDLEADPSLTEWLRSKYPGP